MHEAPVPQIHFHLKDKTLWRWRSFISVFIKLINVYDVLVMHVNLHMCLGTCVGSIVFLYLPVALHVPISIGLINLLLERNTLRYLNYVLN